MDGAAGAKETRTEELDQGKVCKSRLPSVLGIIAQH